MTKTITPETISRLRIPLVMNEAGLSYDDEGAGVEFVRLVLLTLAENIAYADDPAEALRYFVEADGAEVAADFDLPDLAHTVANDAASRYAYNWEVAEAWTGVNGWQVDDELSDVGDARDTIGRMRLGLYLVADRIVWAARAVLNEGKE
jgi:hypothetical protein